MSTQTPMGTRTTEDDRLLSRLVAGGAVLLLAFLASVLAAAPARAHTGLVDVTPAEGATVRAPEQVVLTFSEDVAPSLAVVRLQGPSGPVRLADGPEVSGRRVVQVLEALSPGVHRLSYRVVAGDGHPVSGQTTFTVRASTAAGPAAESGPPADTVPVGQPVTADAEGETASGSSTGGATAAAGALLVLLGAGALVLRRPGARGSRGGRDGP